MGSENRTDSNSQVHARAAGCPHATRFPGPACGQSTHSSRLTTCSVPLHATLRPTSGLRQSESVENRLCVCVVLCAYARPTPLTQASHYAVTPAAAIRSDSAAKNDPRLSAPPSGSPPAPFPPSRSCSSESQLPPVIWGILGHLFLVRHFVDFQQCPVPGATFKGIARPNPSADRRAKSNTDSPRRVGPVLDFATENKDPHFSMILGLQ